MTITQTVDIPADRRITVPSEVPTGTVVLTFTSARTETQVKPEKSITEQLNNYYQNHNSHLDDDLRTASYRLLAEVDW